MILQKNISEQSRIIENQSSINTIRKILQAPWRHLYLYFAFIFNLMEEELCKQIYCYNRPGNSDFYKTKFNAKFTCVNLITQPSSATSRMNTNKYGFCRGNNFDKDCWNNFAKYCWERRFLQQQLYPRERRFAVKVTVVRLTTKINTK